MVRLHHFYVIDRAVAKLLIPKNYNSIIVSESVRIENIKSNLVYILHNRE
jgi:hypothetical protein